MLAGQTLSPRKLQELYALASFTSKKARLMMCTIGALIILASSFVAVAAEPVSTGFYPTNHPVSGDATPFRALASPLLSHCLPPATLLLRRNFEAALFPSLVILRDENHV